MKHTSWGALATASCVLLLAGAAWGWQRTALMHHVSAPLAVEPWEQVRDRFPMPLAFDLATETPMSLLQAVVRANPFSSQRRQVSERAQAGARAGSGSGATPLPPAFIYKGRVLLGSVKRAILEDAVAKKTYFLQIGQEVAGFKVLDISETQVVLSPPGSKEPFTLSLTPKP